MPNWCINKLTITGPKADRDNFINGFPTLTDDDTHPEFIKNYIPMPEGTEDWYTWATKNWGTKWGDCDTRIITDDSEETILMYNTAWAPALPAIQTISGMFPTLKFANVYDESGMCFMGAATFVNGECIFDTIIEHNDYPAWDADNDEDMDDWNNQIQILFSDLTLKAVEAYA
jgi:hypothetical protein